jgi:hypothetical protein
MPSHWIYRPQDFPFNLGSFDGENIEWSWKYNMSKVQLWAENEDGPWMRNAEKVRYAADEMYPNKPPNFGYKLFFYQTLGWHWDANSNQLKRGLHSPFYNSSGQKAAETTALQAGYEGLGELAETNGTDDLVYEENYHRARLELSAIDAILHRVSPELKVWLEGGPRPARRTVVSPSSRPYRTRGTAREIAQGSGASSSRAALLGPTDETWTFMRGERVILLDDSESD